jgi:hypothetical protein
MRRRKAISPEAHILQEHDYFHGCKTILNSEKAALKVAR